MSSPTKPPLLEIKNVHWLLLAAAFANAAVSQSWQGVFVLLTLATYDACMSWISPASDTPVTRSEVDELTEALKHERERMNALMLKLGFTKPTRG